MRIDNDGFVTSFWGELFVVDGKYIASREYATLLCRSAEGQRLKVLGCETIAEALMQMRRGVKADIQRERFGWRCIDGQWFDNEEQARDHGIMLAAEQRELRRLCPVLSKVA